MNNIKLPPVIAGFVNDMPMHDVSGRSGASTYRIDRGDGYFLKIADEGKLSREARMTSYFSGKGLSAHVVEFVTADGRDFLLTENIGGRSGISDAALADPKRLTMVYAESLRQLHDSVFHDCNDISGCMNLNVPEDAELNEYTYTECADVMSSDTAQALLRLRPQLKCDTMLHGDYCLPNILIDGDYKLRGFIDLGEAGMGDRHFDLFWGVWSLWYNLKSNSMREYFLDCYGRDKVDFEMLRLCAVISALT